MAYLDYNSTTPVDRRVLDAMMPALTGQFGNPSSTTHPTGAAAAEAVEEARGRVAEAVGMSPADVIFTSGATEANNLALSGLAAGSRGPLRILAGATEHKSVLEACRALAGSGATFERLPVMRDGTLDMAGLAAALGGPEPGVVSAGAANSETGVLHPVREIAEAAHGRGALFHCDATQAVGKVPFDAGEIGADMVTLSSHKIYGPKGCGALVASREARRRLRGLLRGGGQEGGMRSGTLNVPGIVGFGMACRLAAGEGLADALRQASLRDAFEAGMASEVGGVEVNGGGAPRLPNTSSVRIRGAIADAVMVNAPAIEISTGSACSSAAMEPSHVLTAMGIGRDAAEETVRVSLGRPTVREHVDLAVSELARASAFVREKEMAIQVGGAA